MNVSYLYPLTKTNTNFIDIDRVDEIKKLLQIITKKIEPRIKLLEFLMRQYHHEDQEKTPIDANFRASQLELSNLIKQWEDHCRRLGATPISPFQCRINTEEGHYHWQYTYLPKVAIS
ncbi:MAG: hypothetical protein QE271_14190 [Bacteriovoracaceae bacterium]|nr:hypothetical protein [Bacteriovoracaceae bacterium]